MIALVVDTKQFERIPCSTCEGDSINSLSCFACLGAGELQQLVLVEIVEYLEEKGNGE
ncbi:hypothetical protein SAMN04487897_13632 [Paenibacillus sp. yr247]|uniref:hypothetical protein n=1 Tax=Paenibacillus sp. yr247 TaxID=1761880 RepID=UPI0008872400|nr:hypothetical protein [Paenibacillus sp. yr247]SDP10294.1 hypothetical protein SAMN04487897_13632 [Paenibacillus sp. yr247]